MNRLQVSLLIAAATQTMRSYDAVNGGFGSAPKFPQAPNLEFMLRVAQRSPGLRDAIENTLRKMALGGIYDQIGGGFARYAVDATWTVPHFEKMLYDNAQLARVYTHAWQAYKDPLYERIAVECLEYLLRDMRDDAAGFHSSEDADSEGVEGKFYVWDHDEFMKIAPEAADYYGITPDGNFEDQNILTAKDGEDPPVEARARLLEDRSKRVRPGKDDKVLTSWNGLAIAAFAEAGAALDRADFVDAAREAADFVLQKLAESPTELLHTYRNDPTRGARAHINGLLEDYAFMADGLLALWEATFEERWLNAARELCEAALERFGDPGQSGFFTAPPDHDLIVRQKEIVESATPAPGAILSLCLQKLALLFDRPEFSKPAVDSLRLVHPYMDRAAQAVPSWLSALDFYVSTPKELAFTGNLSTDLGRELTSVVTSRFMPNRVMAGGDSKNSNALLADKPPTDKPTAYVCERYVCQAPTSDPEELASQLG